MQNILKDKLVLSSVGILAVSIGIYIYINVPFTQSQRINNQCQERGKIFLEQHTGFAEGDLIGFFYSHRLDTCVLKKVNELKNEYSLYDITQNYLKPSTDEFRIAGQIFLCDKLGVDNVVLVKAEKYNGVLFHVPYADYVDNGEGGKPRALKAPKILYTREKCQELFNKKLKEIM